MSAAAPDPSGPSRAVRAPHGPAPHAGHDPRDGGGPRSSALGRMVRLAAVLAVLVQLAVLYVPRAPSPSGLSLPPWTDLVVHAGVFGLVTVLTMLAWPRRAGLIIVLSALHAPLSELIQHVALPHRSGDPRDVAADLVGVALGALLAVAVRRGGSRGRGKVSAPS